MPFEQGRSSHRNPPQEWAQPTSYVSLELKLNRIKTICHNLFGLLPVFESAQDSAQVSRPLPQNVMA
jgi:hypothetical protein